MTVARRVVVEAVTDEADVQVAQRNVRHAGHVARLPLGAAAHIDDRGVAAVEHGRGVGSRDLVDRLELVPGRGPRLERVRTENAGHPVQADHRQVAHGGLGVAGVRIVDEEVDVAVVREQ